LDTQISITTSNGTTVCPGAPFSGTWAGDTCSITGRLLITPGTTLDIGHGVTVSVSSSSDGTDAIDNVGTVNNYGTIAGTGDGNNSAGIQNGGTLNNYGTMTGTSINFGIYNAETINNCGRMTGTSTAGGYGIENIGGIINNCGTMTGTSATFHGIDNTATINNYGTMAGTASGGNGTGIDNGGGHAINNYGNMTGTGAGKNYGINNHGIVNNYCNAMWSSTPPLSGYNTPLPPGFRTSCAGSAVLTTSICVSPGSCGVTTWTEGGQFYDSAA
jgi:hypothetical protein